MLICISLWVLSNFLKTVGQRWLAFFSSLVRGTLFPPCALILENKSDVLGVHVGVWKNSEI